MPLKPVLGEIFFYRQFEVLCLKIQIAVRLFAVNV